MEQFILQLGMMSLQASIVICVVLLVRLLFVQMRVPKKYMCILWILPYLCMVCPWKFETDFGFWRMPEQVQVEQIQDIWRSLIFGDESEIAADIGQVGILNNLTNAEIDKGSGTVTNVETGDTVSVPLNAESGNVTDALTNSKTVGTETGGSTGSIADIDSKNTFSISFVLNLIGCIWAAGIVCLLGYSLISYLKLKKKLICSLNVEENIYIADDINVPFVLGIFKTRIYLPSDLPQENLEYVVAHERTHICRRDPVKKILALVITSLHWFNPLSWAAFHFMEKDMEMACDEETVRELGLEHKKDYAEALLALSTGKKLFLGVPLAFDEGNVKGRICNILKYKKTWRVVSGLA